MTGLKRQSTVYKELRLQQLLKLKGNVQSIQMGYFMARNSLLAELTFIFICVLLIMYSI